MHYPEKQSCLGELALPLPLLLPQRESSIQQTGISLVKETAF